MQSQRGFTLLELMVVVVVVSILAAIAVPSYFEYITRGRIPEATSMLSTKQVKIEQFFMDNRTYAGAPDCNNDTTSGKYFDFACSAQSATTFTLTATGKGPMLGFTYSITQAGAKSTAFVTGAPSGWSAASPNNCWVTKKGGVC